MAVYMVIEVQVLDPALYAEYTARVPAVVAQDGGRYLVRGGDVVPLTGDWRPDRIVILEFAAMEQMTAWNFSPEYLALAPLRARSATARAIALHGVAG